MLRFSVDSRIGRQPNALKHATFLQLCRIKSAKGLASSADPFALLETKPDLTEADGSGAARIAASISPDQTVTTSHDSRTFTSGQKKTRRPYRRRSVKAAAGMRDSSTPVHYIDSTQSHLSPVEIKQETLSPVDCNVGELLDQFGIELDQDFAGCGQQRLTEKHHERGSQDADDSVNTVEYDGDSYHASEPIDDFQACASSLAETVPDDCLNAQRYDCVSAAISTATASSETVQSDYQQVIRSMQEAFYDLLSILHRVRYV